MHQDAGCVSGALLKLSGLGPGTGAIPPRVNEGGSGGWQPDLIERDKVRHVGETKLFVEPGEQPIEKLHRGELSSRNLPKAVGVGCETLDIDERPARASARLTVERDHGLLESMPFFLGKRAFENDHAQVIIM